MTQPLTFACPKCGRRMGVGLELSGKQVRCPHCRQVVIAPSNTPPRSAESPPERSHTPPEAFAPSTEGEYPVPKFAPPPRREGAESIFGDSDHEDDSLFAAPSAGPKPLVLDLPSSMDMGAKQPSGAIDFNPAPERESLPATDAIESGDIPRPILGPATPFIKKDISQPDFELFAKLDPGKPPPEGVAKPIVIPPAPPAARSDEVVNPFAKLSRPALPGVAPSPPNSGRRLGLPAAPVGRGTLFWVLVSYAAAVTLFAAWGWTRGRTHPLSAIPDFFGQYRQADPKKVSALPVDANQAIPAELRVKLGEKLALGELEFEPLSIEEKKTKWEVKGEAGRSRDIECLVLTARVRNVSKGHAFCPLDPAFNRFAAADAPLPLSAVVVGADRYPGGPIPWPFVPGTTQYVFGQERDGEPLQPGEDRTTVVPSIDGEKGRKLMDGVRATKGPLLWQVHVRRGFISYQGEEVSVGALIGVEFNAGQVKRVDGPGKPG